MATAADSEVVSAECTTAVVTPPARRRAPNGTVLQDGRTGDLLTTAGSGSNGVALGARHACPAVRSVCEARGVCTDTANAARRAAELVAGSAGRDVAPARLRIRRMAGEADGMRADPRRNRKPLAAPIDAMARHAPGPRLCGALRVSRMIELCIETAEARKDLHCARCRVRVADRADRTRRVRELLGVAPGAGCVPRPDGFRDPFRTSMAQETRKPGVLPGRMAELGVFGTR